MPAQPPEPFVSAEVIEAAAAAAAAAPAVPPQIATPQPAHPTIGQAVRVLGRAEDSKLSGVIIGEALVVHCMGQADDGTLVEARFDDGVLGKAVAATGTLVYSEQFVATVADDGAISQGAEGGLWALVGYDLELDESGTPPEPVEPAPAEPVPAEPEAPASQPEEGGE